MKSGSSAHRPLAFLLAFACGAAAAAVPPLPDDDSLRLDGQVHGLKNEALALTRELLTLEDRVQFSAHTRTSIYVAVKIGGFMVKEITLTVNDAVPVTYNYSESEQRALLYNGYHRLARLTLEPGAHRLQAEFTGQFYDAPKNTPPLTGRLETIFGKGPRELDLVLPISRNSRLDRPGLPEVSRLESQRRRSGGRDVWLPEPEQVEPDSASFEPGSNSDPRLRAAIYLKEDKRFFSALQELQTIQASVADPAKLHRDFWWLMAECYLGFGMQEPAEDIYRRLAGANAPAEQVARARIRLADFEYQRGYYKEATDTLLKVREKLPADMLAQWQQAVAEVLLAQGRYNEAVEILTEGRGAEGLPLHMRYNLGVALINDGKLAQGRNILDKVGTSDPPDEEALRIRDKANIVLAYHFLQTQQGGTAKPIFQRVRLKGPYANRALLGLGWAEMTPRGDKQERAALVEDGSTPDDSASLGVLLRPGYVDADVYKRLGLRPFKQSKMAQVQEAQLRKALVPWSELVTRDAMDPAVQEGLLAMPYVMDKLAANEQALQLYNRAIESLEKSRKRIDTAQTAIKQGRMVETIVRRDLDAETGWMWKLKDLPDTPETYFLQALLAENRFQEPMKNYRDLRFGMRNLDAWRSRLDAFAAQQVNRKGGVSPEALFEQAVDGWEAPWGSLHVQLREAAELAAPGTYDAALDIPNPWWVDLVPALAPNKFDGLTEQIPWLRARVETLKPHFAQAATQQSKNLQKLALKELDGQKETVETYLVQARFAVARLYDRGLQGGAR